jgi:hypothetical protein
VAGPGLGAGGGGGSGEKGKKGKKGKGGSKDDTAGDAPPPLPPKQRPGVHFPQAYGADVLRLWVASTDFASDVALGPSIMASVSESLRKVRNTCRFLLGAGQPLGTGPTWSSASGPGSVVVTASGRFGRDVDPLTQLWSRCAVDGGVHSLQLTQLDR